jgi:hypothetical protein
VWLQAVMRSNWRSPPRSEHRKKLSRCTISGNIHYFSAGIGQVEREATYPPFPLKLVFTAGGKPFVTGVEIVLRHSTGATVLRVPREQVTGPWLFIDVPDGAYDVAATLGDQTQQVKGMKVRRGHVTTQHVRWAEDRSPVLSIGGRVSGFDADRIGVDKEDAVW